MAIIELGGDTTLIDKIEYEVFINHYVGLYFEKDFVIDFNHELITKVELIPMPEVKEEPCKLKVIFYLSSPYKKNTLMPAADELLNMILDYLAFEYGISIKSTRYLDGVYLSVHAVVTHGFTKEQIAKMEAEIPQCKSEPYKRLYRAALQSVDPIARFMFLYSILFDVLEAEIEWGQFTVDSFIRKHCKDVYKRTEDKKSKRIQKNKKPPRYETIYTWLRNQVGHTQSDSEIIEIGRMIDEKLGELSTIVKKAFKLKGVA
ncbi:methylamine utilization protein MauJ [Bacillus sp. 1P10SD]|uniref:methylamine utilization protein MauJ n=1 Tax=Bacillus sp. 1P10SD TaxID=3132265 RepID=UPI0039A67EF0